MNSSNDRFTAKALSNQIRDLAHAADRTLKFMEVCGTHTMAIHSTGLKSLLPVNVELVSGPGCPVCVTQKQFIDEAITIAKRYDACLVTFGDLIRVPGSTHSLASYRAEGGNVKIVYSPVDSIALANQSSHNPVIFLGVGFETTIPTIAATVKMAKVKGMRNFYVLPAFKTIHPPLKILATQKDLSGFLLPGHVSAILGRSCYEYLVRDFHKPGAVAGFEALDILIAIKHLVEMVTNNAPEIVNDYKTVVREHGNPAARAIISDVFEPADASWRGLDIPMSGLQFRPEYSDFDARLAFSVDLPESKDDPRCKCASIITGAKTPKHCALFGKECTPEDPVGPCMVSSEGTCAAYYKYGVA